MIVFLAACVLGLPLLTWAADQFVLGAARLAAGLRIAPAVVGVVILGFGTSAPELVVAVLAASTGRPELTLGDVIGSNLANLTLVLGVVGLITPVAVSSSVLRREAPLSVAAGILFAVAVRHGLHRLDGLLLVAVLAAVLWLLVRGALRSPADELAGEVSAHLDTAHHPLRTETLRTALGLAGTLSGAQLLVWGAAGVAARAGLSQGLVGATLVAVGTSAPEMVTAVQAARRGEADLLAGELLGSNLFNSLGVGGVIALATRAPLHHPGLAGAPLAVMVAASLAAWWFLFRDRRLARWEAAVLVSGYAAALLALAR